MTAKEIIEISISVLTLLGIIFAVYLYFRKPQEASEKTDALLQVQVSGLIKELANLKDNHIHTLEIKITETKDSLHRLELGMTRLETLMEERLPGRNKPM